MTMVLLDGPQPPPQRNFCTPCMLLYKAAVIGAMGSEITDVESDGNATAVKTYRMKDWEPEGCQRPRLSVGIALVNGNPQLGVVHVCWEHMMIVNTATPTGLNVAHGDVSQALASMGLTPGMPGQRR